MLSRSVVFIAEDEPLIALDLAMAVEAANGVVIGPAESVAEALRLLNGAHVHAALLDVHLSDGDIDPIAERLSADGVPLLFHCGLGLTPSLKGRYPEAPVLIKPTPPARLVSDLAGLIAK